MKYWMIIGQFLLAFAVQADSLSLLSAEGFGFADAKRFPESQARLMAVRAAKIDAQRNLLETINGVRVTAGTTVKDMALESDIIGTRVKGMLQGSFEVSSDVKLESDNWVASVTMAVCLAKDDGDCRERTTLASITQPNLKGAPAAERFSQADVAAVATHGRLLRLQLRLLPPQEVEKTPAESVEGASVSEQPAQSSHGGRIWECTALRPDCGRFQPQFLPHAGCALENRSGQGTVRSRACCDGNRLVTLGCEPRECPSNV